MLKELFTSVNSRYKLALSITAGWDSRVLLAASKDHVDTIYIYTLILRRMTKRSYDVAIPQSILNKQRIKHHILDCRSEIDINFHRQYKANVDLAHDSWADGAYGILEEFPYDRIALLGSCLEIARCFYYQYGIHDEIFSPHQLVHLEPGWDTIPFIGEYIEGWLKSATDVCSQVDLDILDLFYWEHRMGGWLAQALLEWDIAYEALSLYNYRPLLVTMLGTPIKYRRAPNYSLVQRTIEYLWPDLLNWPINPTKGFKSIELHLRKLLLDIGLYDQVRKQYRKI